MKNLKLLQRFNRSVKKRIAGFTLIELALAGTIATLGTSAALYSQQQTLRSDIGRAQGEQLVRLANALNIYMHEYYTQISNNVAIPYNNGTGTVANRLAPTFEDLQGLSLADASSSPVSMFGPDYVFSVQRSPAGCVAGTCILTATAHIPTPILEPVSGGIDGVVISEAVITGQGLVGTNDPSDPTTIRGFRNGWTMPNPILGNPEGLLMAQVSYGATFDAYLRRDGSNRMIGQLDMNGNQIVGASTITAAGRVSGSQLTSTGQVSGTTGSFSGALTAGSAQISGNLSMASATVAGSLAVGGMLSANEITATGVNGLVRAANFVVDGVASVGQVCPTPGQIRRTSTGDILACESGAYKKQEAELPQGSMCGMRVTGDGRGPALRPCMGSDPIVRCPTGFSLHSFPGFDFVFHHTCMKT